MSKHKLRIGTLTAASVLLPTVVTVGSGSIHAGDSPATLRMAIWSSNEDHLALLDDIAAEFVDQSSSVAGIEFQSRGFAEFDTALATQLAGGDAPDLAWVSEPSAKQYIASGVLADVGDAMREHEGYDLDDVTDSALAPWTDGEAIYAYPFSTSPFGVFYNADYFEEADLPNPDELVADGEWTWEKLADVSGEIVDQGIARAGFELRDFNFQLWVQLAIIWHSFGASPWSEDGTDCEFADPPMVDAMTYFHDLVFETGGSPEPGTSSDFFAGDAAMSATQISRAALLDGVEWEWGLVPLPSGPAGEAPVIGQAGVGVLAASSHREQATDFLLFLTNRDNSARLARFFPPARASQLTAEVLAEANPLLSGEQLDAVVIRGIENGEPPRSHVNRAALDVTIRAELDALWVPGADVEEVLGRVCDAAQPLLIDG